VHLASKKSAIGKSLVVQPCKQEVSNWEMAVRHDDELTARTRGDITVVPRNR
jgi:hypothetical protein